MPYTKVTEPQVLWDEVFASCSEHDGTIVVSMDGKEDNLVIMTQKAYDLMAARFQLYALLEEGMEDVRNGRVYPAREAIEEIRAELAAELAEMKDEAV